MAASTPTRSRPRWRCSRRSRPRTGRARAACGCWRRPLYHALRGADAGWRPLFRGLPRIAYVALRGAIHRGSGSRGIASDSVRRLLEALGRDGGIHGVVLRIESPGGDGVASDLLWRAVAQLAKEKPVVASMGDVAASGGYYLASAADTVFAEAGTLTGSIGVVGGKPNLEGLYRRIGVASRRGRARSARGDALGSPGLHAGRARRAAGRHGLALRDLRGPGRRGARPLHGGGRARGPGADLERRARARPRPGRRAGRPARSAARGAPPRGSARGRARAGRGVIRGCRRSPACAGCASWSRSGSAGSSAWAARSSTTSRARTSGWRPRTCSAPAVSPRRSSPI